MFTGIIHKTGVVNTVSSQDNLLIIKIDDLSSEIGDSISVDGVCLTLTDIHKNE